MKTRIYLPAFFLVMLLSSSSLFVDEPLRSTDQDHTLSINAAAFQSVPNFSSIYVRDENNRTNACADVKMGVTIPGILPSGLPPIIQFYIMLSTQIQRWIWEIQPMG